MFDVLKMTCVLCAAVTWGFSSFVRAETITNLEPKFYVTIPDGFTKLRIGRVAEPNALFKFVNQDESDPQYGFIIQINRLRGRISADSKLELAHLPKMEGVTSALMRFRWNGSNLNAVRQKIELPNGQPLVSYAVQYPLAPKSIQLMVAGPLEEDASVFELFTKVGNSVVGEHPSHRLSATERGEQFGRAIVQVVFTVIVLVVVFRIATSRSSGENPKGHVDDR